jgi:hypothetical protein
LLLFEYSGDSKAFHIRFSSILQSGFVDSGQNSDPVKVRD